MESHVMDRLDWRILDILQQDSRVPVQQLAEQAGSSASSVWRRIRAMEAAGIIAGFRAEADPGQLGLLETVYLQVSLDRHSEAATGAFVRRIIDEPCVLECHAVTGEHDYLMKVVARDLRAYYRFLEELMRMPEVERTSSVVTLKCLKSTRAISSRLAAT